MTHHIGLNETRHYTQIDRCHQQKTINELAGGDPMHDAGLSL